MLCYCILCSCWFYFLFFVEGEERTHGLEDTAAHHLSFHLCLFLRHYPLRWASHTHTRTYTHTHTHTHTPIHPHTHTPTHKHAHTHTRTHTHTHTHRRTHTHTHMHSHVSIWCDFTKVVRQAALLMTHVNDFSWYIWTWDAEICINVLYRKTLSWDLVWNSTTTNIQFATLRFSSWVIDSFRQS